MSGFRAATSPQVYTAPGEIPNGSSIFIAGGITDCHDWQSEIIEMLLEGNTKYNILNPRRANFPINDPSAAEAQIKWEYKALHAASAILFWFPSETLCPITLYELGANCQRKLPIFIGCHPAYGRLQDVVIQTELCRPEIKVVFNLSDLAQQVLENLP